MFSIIYKTKKTEIQNIHFQQKCLLLPKVYNHCKGNSYKLIDCTMIIK